MVGHIVIPEEGPFFEAMIIGAAEDVDEREAYRRVIEDNFGRNVYYSSLRFEMANLRKRDIFMVALHISELFLLRNETLDGNLRRKIFGRKLDRNQAQDRYERPYVVVELGDFERQALETFQKRGRVYCTKPYFSLTKKNLKS